MSNSQSRAESNPPPEKLLPPQHSLTLAGLSSPLVPWKVGVTILMFSLWVPLLPAMMAHNHLELHWGNFSSSGQSVAFSGVSPACPLNTGKIPSLLACHEVRGSFWAWSALCFQPQVKLRHCTLSTVWHHPGLALLTMQQMVPSQLIPSLNLLTPEVGGPAKPPHPPVKDSRRRS